ncbi:hypothetical protein Nepgr_023701 [Nepenthes gracilis]|uniref:Uncharacterized protein n=1 Tax=Nepenthes gracilis TaxID=150966 RepID=A0AAD3T1F6_NEPGR|nr:hypothetical protein Nepgr_023701 [Nepenthes gracilis]
MVLTTSTASFFQLRGHSRRLPPPTPSIPPRTYPPLLLDRPSCIGPFRELLQKLNDTNSTGALRKRALCALASPPPSLETTMADSNSNTSLIAGYFALNCRSLFLDKWGSGDRY